MSHDHGDEPFPRHALVDLVSAEEAGRARREVAQRWLIGLGLALLALALPNSPLTAISPRRWGAPATPIPFTMLAPLVRALAGILGRTYEQTVFLMSALGWGLSLPILVGTLRRIGFDRTTAFLAGAIALTAPMAWLSATTPVDYGTGVFGASLLMAALFAESGRRALVPLALFLAASAHPEALWLLPAVLWASRRDRPTVLLVCAAAAAYYAILYGGTPLRRAWFAADPIGIDLERLRNLGHFPRSLLGLGAGLIGLYALMVRTRSEQESPPPTWVFPWCFAFVAGLLPGHPGGVLVGAYIIPVAALGVADALQRDWGRWREDRILRAGAGVLALHVALSAFAHGHVIGHASPQWFRAARQHLAPTDFVYTPHEERAWVFRARWGLDAHGPRSRPDDLAHLAERAALDGRRVVVDGIGEGAGLPDNARLRAAVQTSLTLRGVVPRSEPR